MVARPRSPSEQLLFARLPRFAAAARSRQPSRSCDAELETLVSLLDKSLVRRRTEADGSERYWMLETIHELAADRLAEHQMASGSFAAMPNGCSSIARAARMPVDDIGRAGSRTQPVLRERENVRAAIEWAVEHDPCSPRRS